MTPNNTDEQIRHVFDEWHRAVKDQDAEGMAALYAHDGVLETPAVLALWPEREDAVVHGRDAWRMTLAKTERLRAIVVALAAGPSWRTQIASRRRRCAARRPALRRAGLWP